MIRRRDVLNEEKIFSPRKIRRVLGAGDQKTFFRQAPRRLQEKLLQSRLAI
jgi:hypothetical protein